MHGGTNRGAPNGEKNGAYCHGQCLAKDIAQRRELRELIRESRKLLLNFPRARVP
jgi:hypothetical protein